LRSVARGVGATLIFGLVALTAAASPSGTPAARARQGQCADAAVSLGARLFADRRLSADGTISCATCHRPDRAFADGLPVARGIGNQSGTRNTPSLLNASLSSRFPWDGRRASLEEQVLDPFVNSREHGLANHQALLELIRANPTYVADFTRAAPPRARESISLSAVAAALSCYVRALSAQDSAFDRFMYKRDRHALTEGQQRGLKLFQGRARCASCHLIGESSASFADGEFHSAHVDAELLRDLPAILPLVRATPPEKLGELVASRRDVAALGRFLSTQEPGDLGRFRTPSLRNVELTAPYMHDGSVPTLALAVERELYYRNSEADHSVTLTPAEAEDLVAFLKSLTSTSGTHPQY
jgi:cytochrome c peroxidase